MFKSKAKRLFGAVKLQHQRRLNQDEAEHYELEQPVVAKQEYFNFKSCHRTYSCAHCCAHLADHDQLISKLFQGNHGRAYLFNKVVNIRCKQAVQRELLTGLHAVADIYCDNCETTLGWKYEQAFVPSQKYKEGKYIIELVHMLKENNWDLTSYNACELIREVKLEQLSSQATHEDYRQHNYSNPSASLAARYQRPASSALERVNNELSVRELAAVQSDTGQAMAGDGRLVVDNHNHQLSAIETNDNPAHLAQSHQAATKHCPPAGEQLRSVATDSDGAANTTSIIIGDEIVRQQQPQPQQQEKNGIDILGASLVKLVVGGIASNGSSDKVSAESDQLL